MAERADRNAWEVSGTIDRVILAGLLATILLAVSAAWLRAGDRRFDPPMTPSARGGGGRGRDGRARGLQDGAGARTGRDRHGRAGRPAGARPARRDRLCVPRGAARRDDGNGLGSGPAGEADGGGGGAGAEARRPVVGLVGPPPRRRSTAAVPRARATAGPASRSRPPTARSRATAGARCRARRLRRLEAPGRAKISLATATVDDLRTLDGIGPALARRIVEHRERVGGFDSVKELGAVDGIGAKRLADLEEALRP